MICKIIETCKVAGNFSLHSNKRRWGEGIKGISSGLGFIMEKLDLHFEAYTDNQYIDLN